jgi:hypothetical protein
LTKQGLFPQEMQYQWKKISANVSGGDDFSNWKSRVADASKLNYDARNLKYVLQEDLMLDMNKILSGYDIKIDRNNFIRYYVGRPVKRQIVKLGLLPYPYN